MALDTAMPVLIVDDNQTMVRIIRRLLGEIGFTAIEEARDGASAFDALKARSYGLVISDWNMQPMSGYALLQKVRADSALRATPFIMITAESKTENVVAAHRAGVDNYIVKPFTVQMLKSKIESACGTQWSQPARATVA